MSAYIAPVLNNGLLNTTFNSSDFEGTYPNSFLPLSGGNITGGLNVSEKLGVSGVIDANDLIVSGNVGIGTTTSPTNKLQITDGACMVEHTGANNNSLIINPNNHSNGVDIEVFQSDNSSAKKSLCLNPYGGAVGIGTTSPSSILEISKSLSSGTDNSFMINFQNTYSGYYDWAIGPCMRNNAGVFCIRGGDDGFSNLNDLVTVHANGKVGIGTTSPSYKFYRSA